MRIVHVVADLDAAKGGPVTAILGLARAQAAAGDAVRIVATDVGWRGGEPGVAVDLFPSWDRGWRFSPALARGLAGPVRDADLVHLHGLWDFPILAGAAAARRADRPYVLTLHGMLNALAQPQRSWRKRGYLALAGDAILRDASLLHFTTESESANARAAGFGGEAFVCPFGTEVFPAPDDSAAFRARHGLGAADLVVLFVGRLHPQKQPELLIAAFASAARALPSARLVFVGGAEAGYVRTLAATAHSLCGDRIVFTGALDPAQVREAYAACALLVLPSTEESLGLAALEAMAAARAVIVTPGVGLASAIAAAGAGVVVDSNEASVARALLDLLQRPEERRRMGLNARRLVESSYAWERVARSLGERYGRITARATAS